MSSARVEAAGGRRGGVSESMLEALMEATAAVLAADSLDDTFARMTRHLGLLVPHDDLVVYEIAEAGRMFQPVFACGQWEDQIMAERFPVGEGLTGEALRARSTLNVPRTDLHPLSKIVPGTPREPEAMLCALLMVEDRPVGTLNVYRMGEDAGFTASEAEVIERFAVMVALAFNSARQREFLRAQASTDGLTGLLNYRACHERMHDEVARALRARAPISVVVLDLDRFKEVNDTHGHAEGDRVLRAVAHRLLETVRTEDGVARLGGEEFALILPGVDLEGAVEAAERGREAVAEVAVAGRGLTASAGVATCPDHGIDPRQLLVCADAALYRAKRSGRDRTAA